MLLKPRSHSLNLNHLEHLLQRLKPNHPAMNQVHERLASQQAGCHGEQSLDFHLDYLQGAHYILHNLRLYDDIHFFQIDTLILFPNFFLIIEAKNMKGQISIHRQKKEMRRESEGFQDPVEQAERQKRLLGKWLKNHLGIEPPIDFLVVFTNKRCTLEFDSFDSKIHEKVIRGTSLVDTIESKRIQHRRNGHPPEELILIGRKLASAHEEYVADYMQQFQLTYSDLQKGVRCPECQKYFMKREKQKWKCGACFHLSANAHEQALREYSALVSQTISNKEARAFLKVNSRHVVYRLLNVFSQQTISGGRYVKYRL